jgi:antirestriction protein ArdC
MTTPAQLIAEKIIVQLELGVKPWVRPWDTAAGGRVSLPLRVNGEAYRGVNVFLLWMSASAMGYTAPRWMSYRQAGALGGQVRKGETGTLVVFYGESTRKGAETTDGAAGAEDQTYRFLKTFNAFNCDQIDGLPSDYYAPSPPLSVPPTGRNAAWDEAFRRVGASVRHGGDQAYFSAKNDYVQMPEIGRFRDHEQYYATLAHELGHYTGGSARLNRVFGKRFGDPAYAAEECVAELTAALVGAAFGLRPDHLTDHAAYIGHWIKALKAEPTFILKVAAMAQSAADFVLSRAAFVSPV